MSLVVLAVFGRPAAGATERTQTVTCPVTGKPFRATLQTSGTVFGVHLDMRLYGPIASPEPVAICPDASRCGRP